MSRSSRSHTIVADLHNHTPTALVVGLIKLVLVVASLATLFAMAYVGLASQSVEYNPIAAARERATVSQTIPSLPTDEFTSLGQISARQPVAAGWRPPPWTAYKTVPWKKLFPSAQTFGDALDQVSRTLVLTDIEPSVFAIENNGFVLVTRRQIERFGSEMHGRSIIVTARVEPTEQASRSGSSLHATSGLRLPRSIANLRAAEDTPVYIYLYEHRYERSDENGNAWKLLPAPTISIDSYLVRLHLLNLS